MNSISIALKVSEFDAKEDLTKLLGLQATHSHYAGEHYRLPTIGGELEKTYKHNYWEHRREYETDEWVQVLADLFINEIIIPRVEILKELSIRSGLEFFIGINYYNEANPSFHFSKELLAVLSMINAELDIDMYCFTK